CSLLHAGPVTCTARMDGYVSGTTTEVVVVLPASSVARNATGPDGGRAKRTVNDPSSATSTCRPAATSVTSGSTEPLISTGSPRSVRSATAGTSSSGGVESIVYRHVSVASPSSGRGTSRLRTCSPSSRSEGGCHV